MHSDALATPTPPSTSLAATTLALAAAPLAATSPSIFRTPKPTFTALATATVTTVTLAPTALALAAPPPIAVFAERGSPLLDGVRSCRPLPIFLWRSGCLLQARPSLGRSRLWLRREGM